MSELLDPKKIDSALGGLPAWHRVGDGLHADFEAPDFPAAIAMVDAVAVQAQEMDHHPDIDVRYRTVSFTVSTHSAGGITAADLELAGRIGAAAVAVGATALSRD